MGENVPTIVFGQNGGQEVFQVVKFESVIKIELGPFGGGGQGSIFAQNLGLPREWKAV